MRPAHARSALVPAAVAVAEAVAAITAAVTDLVELPTAGCGTVNRNVRTFFVAVGTLIGEPNPGSVADADARRLMEEHIEVEGNVVTVLPGTMFRVALDNKHQVLAHISGKMRKRFIRLTVGDRVKLEMSPYDLDKARITYRLR